MIGIFKHRLEVQTLVCNLKPMFIDLLGTWLVIVYHKNFPVFYEEEHLLCPPTPSFQKWEPGLGPNRQMILADFWRLIECFS